MCIKKLLIYFICSLLFTPLIGQENLLDKKINITLRNVNLQEALNELSLQSGLKFSYSSDAINLNEKINYSKNNIALRLAFDQIFKIISIEWNLIGEQITLKQKAEPIKLCGKLNDLELKTPIEYSIVYLKGTELNTQSDYVGNFCIDGIVPGTYTLVIKAFGYFEQEKVLELSNKPLPLVVELKQQNIELNETIVVSDKIIEHTSVSETRISKEQIEAAKGLSNDPMKAITSVPGVLAAVDFYGPQDLHVRGGEGSENLYLLDNIKLPYPFYFIGQSVINPDMLDQTELLTGGFNPNYGNAMSSVFNFSTKTGNMEKYNGHIDFSFFNSSALVQGPIIKNKLSGIIGFRKSNIDLILRALGFQSNMNDLTTKFSYIINEKNKLNFTSLIVTDYLDFSKKESGFNGLKASDKINAQNLQLQSVLSSKAYNKLSVLYSGINARANQDYYFFYINNATYSLRDDYTFYPNSLTKLKAGAEFNMIIEKSHIRDSYTASDIPYVDSTKLTRERTTNNTNYQSAIYLFYEGKLANRFNYIVGGRADHSSMNNAIDFSPRTTIAYDLSKSTIASAAWGLFHQSVGIYDMTQNNKLTSNRCMHYIFSIKQNVYKDIRFKAEAYYKDYKNLVVFDTAFNYTNSGYGYAKGVELSLLKDVGRVNGWLSYSYAISERKRNLQDRVYPSYYDQRNAYNAQITFRVKEKKRKWFVPTSYSIQFKYATGNPYTPVLGVDSLAGRLTLLTGSINSLRNPDYQNLNAKIQWLRVFGKHNQHALKYYIDFWNLYGGKNLVERVYKLTKNGSYTAVDKYTTSFLFSIGIKFIFNTVP